MIFVTAYNRYAIDAFELHARDYLFKPYDRFNVAFEPASEQMGGGEALERNRATRSCGVGAITTAFLTHCFSFLRSRPNSMVKNWPRTAGASERFVR